ncbi:hypothetical protein [Streptomyces sp. NBC_00539]|nr:hypothetical protein [Streptomyces sp. NBC_00539]WUC69271.1 hypothetical protein OG861_34130 [Streptomyces sp. NBC_00539]
MGRHRRADPLPLAWGRHARRFAHDWAYPAAFAYYLLALLEKAAGSVR